MTREEFEQYAIDNGLVVWSNEMSERAIKALEQKPKVGHWINDEDTIGCYYCSECGGYVASYDDAYCKYCGCRMVAPQESEDKE